MRSSQLGKTVAETKVILTSLIVMYEINADLCGLSIQRLILLSCFLLQHHFHLSSDLADSDIYLYNKPGGQGTGGKGNHHDLGDNV